MHNAALPVRPLAACLLGLALAGALSVASALPALAQDDGQESIWTSIGGMVGIGGAPKADIDYRERPPLVLPPKMNLRNPQPSAAARNPAWPVDPDVVARREAADQAKLPVIFRDSKDASATAGQRDLLKDRVAAQRTTTPTQIDACSSEGRDCNRWNSKEGGNLPTAPDAIVAGQEPERGTLTDPPKGYRVATKNVKATTEAPRSLQDDTSVRSFYKTKKQTDDQ